MELSKFKAAAVIASPSLFDLEGTIAKCCSYIEEAANNGAKLVVFPETFLPMYPWWIWMGINNKKKTELYKQLVKNSVDIEGGPFNKICSKAKEKSVYIVIGINERDNMILYNSQVFIDDNGKVIGKRRKLVPTGEERTVWGRGDGSDLFICETNIGKIGGLICYENSMTLSRYALYSMGEQIHIANWPGSNLKSQSRDRTKIIDLASRFVAFEGQVFVIVSSSCLGEEELNFYKELDPSLEDNLKVGGGIAGVISPFGDYVSPPIQDEEGIAYGEIDMESIVDSKHLLDNVGHYARWDVTKLLLNQQKYSPVEFEEQLNQRKLQSLEKELNELLLEIKNESMDEKIKHLVNKIESLV